MFEKFEEAQSGTYECHLNNKKMKKVSFEVYDANTIKMAHKINDVMNILRSYFGKESRNDIQAVNFWRKPLVFLPRLSKDWPRIKKGADEMRDNLIKDLNDAWNYLTL